jgi:hypothetical protein
MSFFPVSKHLRTAVRRRWWIAPLVALVPSALIAVISRDMPHLGRFHDDGLYWVCAKSLAEDSGYRIVSLPDQPFQTKYPPLYPLLLAGIWRLNPAFPENLGLAIALAWMFLPLLVFLAAGVFRDLGLSPIHARTLAALLALNPYIVLYSVSLMSELMFCCLLLGCLRLLRRVENPGSPAWLAAAAGAMAGAAYLTRNAALPLAFTAPLLLAWRGRYARAGLFFAAMLPAVAGWNLWMRAHLQPAGDLAGLYYTDYLGFHLANFGWQDLPALLSRNVPGVLGGAGGLFAVFGGDGMYQALGAAAIAGTAWLALRNGLTHYHLFAAGSIALLLPWHLGLNDRYIRLLLPVLPLLLAGLSTGFLAAAATVRRWLTDSSLLRFATAAAASAALAVPVLTGAGSAVVSLCQLPAFIASNRESAGADHTAYAWIRANLPRDAKLLSGPDPIVYLHTQRRGRTLVVPPRLLYPEDRAAIETSYREIAAYGRAHGLDYVVTRDGENALGGSPGLRLVYRSGGASVYEIERR